MILVPWLESFKWAKQHAPQKPFQKQHLSFITIHCQSTISNTYSVKQPTDIDTDLYIISMSIIGSILLYPAGGLSYIDALFFASGCATQSGLNT